METALPIMLVAMAFYFAFSPKVSDVGGKAVMPISMLGASVIPCIGLYDGFFGPGAGTFYLMALVSLGGMAMTHAVAYSRVLNLFSNAISLLIFIMLGKMVWVAGFCHVDRRGGGCLPGLTPGQEERHQTRKTVSRYGLRRHGHKIHLQLVMYAKQEFSTLRERHSRYCLGQNIFFARARQRNG